MQKVVGSSPIIRSWRVPCSVPKTPELNTTHICFGLAGGCARQAVEGCEHLPGRDVNRELLRRMLLEVRLDEHIAERVAGPARRTATAEEPHVVVVADRPVEDRLRGLPLPLFLRDGEGVIPGRLWCREDAVCEPVGEPFGDESVRERVSVAGAGAHTAAVMKLVRDGLRSPGGQLPLNVRLVRVDRDVDVAAF